MAAAYSGSLHFFSKIGTRYPEESKVKFSTRRRSELTIDDRLAKLTSLRKFAKINRNCGGTPPTHTLDPEDAFAQRAFTFQVAHDAIIHRII